MPETTSDLFLLISGEIFYGLVIGLMVRFLVTALAWGGTVISFLSGLSAAQVFNPLLAEQGTLPAVILTLGGILLIYATDTHHLMFFAIADSYNLFVPGAMPSFGETAESFRKVACKELCDGYSICDTLHRIRHRFLHGDGTSGTASASDAGILRRAADANHDIVGNHGVGITCNTPMVYRPFRGFA